LAYTDLLIQQTITRAADCSQAEAVDNTGEYPADEGGFAPSGDGTATRPSTGQVWFWYMWRFMQSDGTWEEVIPESQTGDPEVIISLLLESGSRRPDCAAQVIEMVVPDSESWDDYSALTWDEIIVEVLAVGALGQAPLFVNCTSVDCTNDALMRLNNAWAAGTGECKTEEYATKKAFLEGATDSINLAAAPTNEDVIGLDTTEQYEKTQVIIDSLVTLCGDETCRCNC